MKIKYHDRQIKIIPCYCYKLGTIRDYAITVKNDGDNIFGVKLYTNFTFSDKLKARISGTQNPYTALGSNMETGFPIGDLSSGQEVQIDLRLETLETDSFDGEYLVPLKMSYF